jgi:hypothetical protein
MAETKFTKSVPYNTIRLGEDVALWSLYERTSDIADTYAGDWKYLQGMQNIRLGDMQRASSTDVEPDDGRVTVGPLYPMRYGIAVDGDLTTTNGVYFSQMSLGVSGTNDFVGTRNWNRASNPQNIRLSRLAQWDYTAVMPVTGSDLMDLKTDTSNQWLQTSIYGCEIFQDATLFAAGVKENGDNSTRAPIVFRSNPYGDKFSTFLANNYVLGTHASDMNGVLMTVPMNSLYGSSYGTAVTAYATIGRRTSTVSNGKIQAYTVTINSNGTISTATIGSSTSYTTNVSTNYTPCGAAATTSLGPIAIVGGHGGGKFDLHRLVWDTGTSTWSSTNTQLAAGGANGARGDVVSAYSGSLVVALWTQTQSGQNRYSRAQTYDFTSGITALGSVVTMFNDGTNYPYKCVRAASLALTDPYWYIITGTSTTDGDIELMVIRYKTDNATWSKLATHTYLYNNASVNDRFSLTNLSSVSKTSVTYTGPGEDFVPGGTNDFEERVYFALCCSTNVETDNIELAYFYYDVTNDDIVEINSNNHISKGRNFGLMKNHYLNNSDDGSRTYAKYIFGARNGAGNVWMPILGGKYVTSSNKKLSVGAIGIDYKPNWETTETADPGSTVYDTIGTDYTTNVAMDTAGTSADWDEQGRWRVIYPHPSTSYVQPITYKYSSTFTYVSGKGISLANVSDRTGYITVNAKDEDSNNWETFFNTLISYNTSNSVYLRLSTNNNSDQATYEIPAGNNRTFLVPYNGATANSGPYLGINFLGSANGHAGDSWAFTNQGASATFIGIEFSQSPF